MLHLLPSLSLSTLYNISIHVYTYVCMYVICPLHLHTYNQQHYTYIILWALKQPLEDMVIYWVSVLRVCARVIHPPPLCTHMYDTCHSSLSAAHQLDTFSYVHNFFIIYLYSYIHVYVNIFIFLITLFHLLFLFIFIISIFYFLLFIFFCYLLEKKNYLFWDFFFVFVIFYFYNKLSGVLIAFIVSCVYGSLRKLAKFSHVWNTLCI